MDKFDAAIELVREERRRQLEKWGKQDHNLMEPVPPQEPEEKPMPDPNPKPTKRRFFLCTGQCVAYKDLHKYPESHILGELRYMTDEGRKVTSLALYLTPIYAGTVPPVKPVIVAYIIGDARLIKCRYADCTRSQRWELGRAGFLALMDRMGYQDKFLAMENEEEQMCADCGHSKSRHETAGGFCKHCPCNEFKNKEEVKDATK